MPKYDHPEFTVVREVALSGNISCAAATSAFVGSSLKVRTKAIVLGCTFRVGSAGSATGSNSFKIARIDTSGTISNMQVLTLTAPVAGQVIDISMTSGFTVTSMGEAAALVGNAASADKIPVLSDIIWRYRLLPYELPPNYNIG